MPEPESSPGAWISQAAHRLGGHSALIIGQQAIDYASLYDRLGRLAHGYLDVGFRPGQAMVVITRHPARLVWTFYLALFSGCPLLTLDPRRSHLLALLKLNIPGHRIINRIIGILTLVFGFNDLKIYAYKKTKPIALFFCICFNLK